MGSKKHLRANRKPRSVPALKPEQDRTRPEPEPVKPDQNPCSEEELEELLLKKLHCYYIEALSKLVALGYDEDLALRAVLRSGHCYGGMDAVSNILHNTMAFLRRNCGDESDDEEEDDEVDDNGLGFNGFMGFTELGQLEEYSLEGMVCMLQQFRPKLTRVDAMWFLLVCDLHVGRASSLEISACGGCVMDSERGSLGSLKCCECGDKGCNGDFSKVVLQKTGLPPSMKSYPRKNANAGEFVAGFRADGENLETCSRFCRCVSVIDEGQHEGLYKVSGNEQSVEGQSGKKAEDVSGVLGKFRDMVLDDKMEFVGEQRGEMVIMVLQRVKELEQQVMERKVWAQQKALQAAQKMCKDLTELVVLRAEREETQRLKKGKQTLDDSTVRRLAEMESALRKASGQVDRANAAVKRFEIENAEIRAEMEAAKLSASESVKSCLEIIKREKKSLKKLLAWEKQKTKLQGDIADEKQKILGLQLDVAQILKARNEAEVKLNYELRAKELALTQVEEERRMKHAAEADSKRKLEALRRKIEIDFHRRKDDMQRLEQEQSRLKASVQAAELQSNSFPLGKSEEPKSHSPAFNRSLELNEMENSLGREDNSDRGCIICMEDEASVVFLPCAHQVICANCNDNYGRKGRAICLCCRVQIEQRIRVYGASS